MGKLYYRDWQENAGYEDKSNKLQGKNRKVVKSGSMNISKSGHGANDKPCVRQQA